MAMETQAPAAETESPRSWTRTAGWGFVGTAAAYVAYLVLALSLGAGYEDDLAAAAESEGTTVDTASASAMAGVVQDHVGYSLAVNTFLFLPGVLLFLGAAAVRSGTRAPAGRAAWVAAFTSLAVLAAYLLLNLGLYADPSDLPPLVRDLDVLTVPMVSGAAVLAVVAVGLAAVATRSVGVAPRASAVALVLSALLGLLGLAGLVGSGFEVPMPPIVVVPAALVLGLAILRRGTDLSSPDRRARRRPG
jgi:hypothetical protein